MTKKDFILLADTLNAFGAEPDVRTMQALCEFMRRSNPNFNESRWRSYLRGECGPNGGPVKKGVAK